MATSDSTPDSLHARTLDAMNQILARALGYVTGLEKVAVDQAVRLLYPRVENRVMQASEEELRVELKHLQTLVEAALAEPAPSKPPRRALSAKGKKASTGRKRRTGATAGGA
ncbi:MAG: hypothetical protein OWU32_14025 [Firmicutes bacterium]|nr:hypothetical protein [Bacillota bacterium]